MSLTLQNGPEDYILSAAAYRFKLLAAHPILRMSYILQTGFLL